MKRKLTAGAATFAVVLGVVIGAAAPANAGIKIYDGFNHTNYLGDYGRGTSYVGSTANNKASSLSVTSPANYAVLYDGRDWTGSATGQFYIGTPNLADWGFNNKTTSIG